MKNLWKKVFILFLLFLAIFSVYLVKNNDVRDLWFDKLKAMTWRDQGKDINIDLEDINITGLIGKNEDQSDESVNPGMGEINTKPETTEEKISTNDNYPTLESIQQELNQIKSKIVKIEKEMENLNTLARMQEQVEEIAREVELISNAISEIYG